jgi:hypothetical protein
MNLEHIENRYNSLDGKKKFLILFFIFILISMLFYALFFESIFEEIESRKSQLARLERDIKKESTTFYLKRKKEMQRDILSLKQKIDRLENKKLALKTKLESLDSILVNNKNFVNVLEKILKNSTKYSVELFQIDIDDNDKPYFKRLMVDKEVEIVGSGEFLNIVKFVRSIEDSPLLLVVDRYVVESNGSTPNFKVDIKFFGADI